VVSQAITNLDQSDFIVAGCNWQQLSVTDNSATITLASCSHGNVSLTLKASSIGALQNGPPQAVAASIQFDGQAPSFTWNSSGGSFSQSSVVLGFSLQDATVSSIAQFDLGGCQGELLDLAVRIFGCPDGAHTISFGPNQLSDSWGNSGPVSAISYQVVFDQTAPVATWSSVEINGSATFSYSAQVNFSESVSFSVSSVIFTSSMECLRGHSVRESGWLFWAECGHGSGSWLLPALSLMDALGNFGPVESVSVSFENLAPLPPTPVSVPATESPAATTPEQTQSQVVTTPPQETQNPQPTQPPVTEPVTQAPVPEPAPQPADATDPVPFQPVIEAPISQSPVIEEAATGSEEVEMAPVSFDDVPILVIEDKAQEVIPQTRPNLPKLSEPEVLEPVSVSESSILDDSPEEDKPIQLAGGEFTLTQEDQFPVLPVALGALALILLLGLIVIRISGR
jgi:hypothetical protein